MNKDIYHIIGHIETKAFGTVPILDIRMMSPEREKELGEKSAEKWENMHCEDGK